MRKLFVIFLLLATTKTLSVAQSRIVIDAGSARERINRHIYGHFSEHLGHCIYEGFYVGENSSIPNTEGVRNDVVNALKKMKIPNLRWPGGCFADTYHWKDGIGTKGQRPSMVNKWWGGVTENNSFGTHDFLNLCERLGAEPYLAGNVGSGTVQELSEWVQYVNFDGSSPMSKLRALNGRDKPWAVRYWGVGNEAWGCGGNMTPEYYANVYKQYATFMSDWSNSGHLFRVASGANSADYHWTEVMMRDIPHDLLEGVALHHYSVIDWNKKGSATDFSEGQYFTTLKRGMLMDELVTRHSAIMDKYDSVRKIALVVDEWGGWYDVEPGTNPSFLFQQNTMRDAVLAGLTLNIFNNHCERVRMANLAQTVNVLQSVILTSGPKIILTPTYHVMEMYSVHQDATRLATEVVAEDYHLGTETLKVLSASASRDESGAIHVSLVNLDASQERVATINLKGKVINAISGRIMHSSKIQDHNSFDAPELIKPQEFTGAKVVTTTRLNGVPFGNTIEVHIPPAAVVLLELK